MRLKSNFFLYVILLQCSSLFSYEFSCGNHDKNNIPHAEIHVNNHYDTSPKNNWHFSAHVSEVSNYSDMQPANYSVLFCQGSPELQSYFHNKITPLIYFTTIQNHCCAVPGYVFPDDLRSRVNELSQFSNTDGACILHLVDRLKSYCTRIEDIVFSGKNHAFCETLSHVDQVKLVKIYADFLKEFYAGNAPYIFYGQSQASSLMQQVMPTINWQYFDNSNAKSKSKVLAQRRAASVNGNLGVVYKALHEGNIEKAYNIGQEQVQVGIGKKAERISVFEKYPALYQQVKQAYDAHQAKIESYSAKATKDKQEKEIQQKAAVVQAECSEHALVKRHFDALQKRYDAATRNSFNPQFSQKIHNITLSQATCFDKEHLTPDQKGILLEGGHLQHHLVDEAITVVDVLSSGDLVESMHDAVLDLANASLSLNKDGDVIMAARTLDACWALIDFAHDAAQYTYLTLSTHVPLLAKGACDGVCESLHGAVHAVCHPVETAQDVAKSFVVAGYCLGKVAYAGCVLNDACDVLESDPKRYEQIIQQYAIDPDVLVAVYEHAKEHISTEDVARVGTKVAVDMMLLHGVTKVVSAIAAESLPTFLSCMRKGGESAEVALTAEGIPVRCAEEVASLMNSMEKASGGIEVAAEAFVNSRNLVDDIVSSFMSEIKAEVETLKQIFECEKNCVPDCVKKGFAEFKSKHIKIPYEHILGIELKWNDIKGTLSGISGFHHDFMGAIEKSGVLKFVRKGIEKNGCYMADVFVGEKCIPGKTFFPQSWSREKVINKIYEAYDNFIKSGAIPLLEKNGKYRVNAFTKEGIEIEMHFTKNGQMATAYPIVKARI